MKLAAVVLERVLKLVNDPRAAGAEGLVMSIRHMIHRVSIRSLLALAVIALAGCTFGGNPASPVSDRGESPEFEDEPMAMEELDQLDYRIGPEDVLEISVWQEEDLYREVVVRPDGGISFPLAGDVHVAGKTANEVRELLTQRIDDYIPGAMVNVSVLEVSGYQIYVVGKVNDPGQFTVGRYVDVMQALTMAGGLNEFASERRISVIRRTADGEEVYPFDYRNVRQGRNVDQNIRLRSGDVVVVP